MLEILCPYCSTNVVNKMHTVSQYRFKINRAYVICFAQNLKCNTVQTNSTILMLRRYKQLAVNVLIIR